MYKTLWEKESSEKVLSSFFVRSFTLTINIIFYYHIQINTN